MKRLMSIMLLVVLVAGMLSACATPAPEPTVEPVATAVPEPAAEPEPFTLVWWSEYGSTCCSDTRDDIRPDGIDEPGDLGRWMIADWHAKNPQYDHVTIDIAGSPDLIRRGRWRPCESDHQRQIV